VQTAGGVGYEIAVPLGVMEQLPPVGESVNLATELVVREDGWALYGFRDESERRFFQRLIGVTGIGPKLAIALMSALGVERAARLDQPATRPGRREARGGRVPHLSHTPRPGGGPPAGSVARAAREQQAGGVSVIL